MEIKQIFINDYKNVITDYITKKTQDIALYGIIPKHIVLKGKGEINLNYCYQNNIEVYESVDFGGGIVASPGDISLIILKHNGWDIGKELLTFIKDFLIQKGLKATIDSNDIVIDEKYKVASYSSVNLGNNYIYSGFQLSFNVNIDFIRKICLKPSVKIPKGLSEYSIYPQEVLNILFERLKNYWLKEQRRKIWIL